MTHLLVTNDFPPKVGGIQSYLWELWRRLPAGRAAVLTTPYRGAAAFDAEAPLPIVRDRRPVLLPDPWLPRRISEVADAVGAGLVVLDPALPVGWIGPRLDRPYAVVLHGAEVTVPARLPGSRQALGRVLRGSTAVVAAGGYPAEEAARCVGGADLLPATTIVPPGVDLERFRPLDEDERKQARVDLGLPTDALVVLGLSRLVPRKGFDVLIEAAAKLADRHPELVVAIAGAGRDRRRLERLGEKHGAPVRFLGRVPETVKAALVGCSDVFAMLCRDRWLGLEQEGFGIVFLEAAACGVPSVAGRSGGAHEAVVDGTTGVVCARPADAAAVADCLAPLVADAAERRRLGRAARERVETELGWDHLARRLDAALLAAEP
jgi:phosphatidylinositol alpha-1,6-mannosyltransferase